MNCAPIALFVYNRADHFTQTYNALAKCALASQSELFIFSDGPKNEQAVAAVNEVRLAAENAAKKGDFKNVTVIKSEYNKGLARSIIEGVTQILDRFGRIIVLEDDCVASPHLLSFMNECLNFYEKDKSIGSIAGYTPSLDLDDYTHDIFLANRSCSCCWATWSDRWKNVDWDMKWMKDIFRNYRLVKALNSNGNDRFMRLYRQYKSNSQSWSIRFGTHLVLNNYKVVYPKYSYIKNIGGDESGVHSTSSDAKSLEADLSKAIAAPKIERLTLDNNIQKKLYRFYSGGLLSSTKRGLATALIIAKERIKNR